jgi:hypothetical protein
MHKLLFAIILWPLLVFSQTQWTRISPLDHCPQYEIEFMPSQTGDAYLVRLPDEDGEFNNFTQIPNINDLSPLTDQIVESSAKLCSNDLELVSFDNSNLTFLTEDQYTYEAVECTVPYRFTNEYLTLMRDIVGVLQGLENADKCAQVSEFVELQTKITQLGQDDLIELENSKNLFHLIIKLFSGDETDEMINLYHTCGRKDGSDKFVSNIILLTARKSCIIPKPPGMLTFDQAKDIADTIGADYKNKSVKSINSDKDEISKRATLAFVDSVLKEEVNGLIGNYIDDTDAFIKELDAYKTLENTELNEDSMDYVSYGFSIDATIEVAEKAIPTLIENSFGDKLPKTWSEERKKKFYEDELLPASYEKYHQCIGPYLEKLAYQKENALSERLKLKDQYCDEHKEQCDPNSCNGSVNLMSSSPDVTDSQIVQGCVMGSIFSSIRPLLSSLINDQKEAFKDSFDLTGDMVEIITDKTWDKLVQCANKRILQSQNLEASMYPEDAILTDDSLLRNTQPEKFEEIAAQCSEVAEANVARDFVTQLLLNTEDLKEAYPDNTMIERDGQFFPEALLNQVDIIVRSSFDTCLAKQSYIKDTKSDESEFDQTNPLFCTPHVEMTAAKYVIYEQLKSSFEDFNLEETTGAINLLQEFENCSDEALTNAQNALGAPRDNGVAVINNEEDANLYLERNNDFYQCVENGIVKTSAIITSASIDKMAIDMKDKISNTDYLLSLKDDAEGVVTECFENTLKEDTGSWKNFTEFNSAGGFARMQLKCEQKVTEFILPKVMIKETAAILRPLKDDGVIANNTEIGNILALAGYRLRQRYDITLPEGIPSNQIVEYSYAMAYREHMQKEGNTMDTFMAEFEEVTLKEAVKNIHSYIQSLANQKAKPDNLDDFFDNVPPSCIVDIYTKFNPEITQLIEDLSNAPSSGESVQMIDMIVDTIVNGVNYSKGIGKYNEQKAQLRDICQNLDQYKEPQDFADAGAFDFILQSTVQAEVINTFETLAIDQCIDEIKALAPNANQTRIVQACKWSDPYNAGLARSVIKAGSSNGVELDFVFDRFDGMKDVIRKHLKDTKKFHEMVFDPNTDSIVDYQLSTQRQAQMECQLNMSSYITLYNSNISSEISKICNGDLPEMTRSAALTSLKNKVSQSYLFNSNPFAQQDVSNTIDLFYDDITQITAATKNTLGNCYQEASDNAKKACMRQKPGVTDYIYQNLVKVLTDDKATKDQVNKRVTTMLFQNTEKGTFAADFAENQLVAGLGIAGYKEARNSITYESINDSVGFWEDIVVDKDKVVKKSKQYLREFWTPDGLRERVNFNGISPAQRGRLIQSMYENSVAPAATGGEANNDAVANDLTNHVENYIYPNGFTFTDGLTEDIAEKVRNGGGIYGIEW